MNEFCKNGKLELKMVRDLFPVLFSGNVSGEEVAYEVCRGEKIKEGLRYDVSVIHPIDLNGELTKTFGHYHKNNFPEIYEVLNGRANFFFQKSGGDFGSIVEVYLIQAKAGDKVIVLPGFGMTTINVDYSFDLVVSNWIDQGVESDYGFYRQFHGACYYFLRSDDGGVKSVKNSHYDSIPELVILRPKKTPEELENLQFLSDPGKHKNLLTIDNLYERV